MTASEILEGLKGLDRKARRALMGEVLADDVGFDSLRSEMDRYAQKAIATHDEKRDADVTLLSPQAVNARLSRIEEAFEAKAKRLALDYEGQLKARDLGVDPALLGRYDDAKELAERCDVVAKAIAKERTDSVTAAMSRTPKPGSGNSSTSPTMRDLGRMAPESIIELEMSGKLNNLLRQ